MTQMSLPIPSARSLQSSSYLQCPSKITQIFIPSARSLKSASYQQCPSRRTHHTIASATDAAVPSIDADWRAKARPIQPGSTYPAKELCSNCGLCDTYYVAHVKDACAFLGDGALAVTVVGGLPSSSSSTRRHVQD